MKNDGSTKRGNIKRAAMITYISFTTFYGAGLADCKATQPRVNTDSPSALGIGAFRASNGSGLH